MAVLLSLIAFQMQTSIFQTTILDMQFPFCLALLLSHSLAVDIESFVRFLLIFRYPVVYCFITIVSCCNTHKKDLIIKSNIFELSTEDNEERATASGSTKMRTIKCAMNYSLILSLL